MKMAKSTKTPSDQVALLQALSQTAAAWLAGVSDRTARSKFVGARNPNGTYDARRLVAALAGTIKRPTLPPDDVETLYQVADAMVDPGLYHGPGRPAYAALQRLVAQHAEGVLLVLVDRIGWLVADAARFAGDAEPQPLRAVVCDYCGRVRRGDKWVKATRPEGCTYDCCPTCETSKAEVPDYLASGKRWDEE